MKRAAILFGFSIVLTALTSCYRSSVCATYVKNDVQVEQEKDLTISENN